MGKCTLFCISLMQQSHALQAAVEEMQRVLLATTRNGNSASEGCELFKASIIQAISLTASVISCDSSELRKVAPLSTADGSLSTERRPPDAREILVTLSASASHAMSVQSCLRFWHCSISCFCYKCNDYAVLLTASGVALFPVSCATDALSVQSCFLLLLHICYQ